MDERLDGECQEKALLVKACKKGDKRMLMRLLRLSKKLDTCTVAKNGYYLLDTCLKKGHLECGQVLIDKGGIDPDSISQHGAVGKYASSLLCKACEHGNVENVLFLIRNGATINPQWTETPICVATQQGHSKIIRLLLEHGAEYKTKADPHWYSANHRQPFFIAAADGNIRCMQVFLDFCGQDQEDKDSLLEAIEYGDTPLTTAARLGSLEAIQFLVEHGAAIDGMQVSDMCQDENREEDEEDNVYEYQTNRFFISDQDHIHHTMVQQQPLSSFVAYPDSGEQYSTATEIAAEEGHCACLKFLLEQGASLNNALHCAADHGNEACLQLLLEYFPSQIDKVNVYDSTPLSAAIEHGQLNCFQFLLKRGANLYPLPDAYAINVAIYEEKIDIVRLLLQHNRDIRFEAISNTQSILYYVHQAGFLRGLPWLPYIDLDFSLPDSEDSLLRWFQEQSDTSYSGYYNDEIILDLIQCEINLMRDSIPKQQQSNLIKNEDVENHSQAHALKTTTPRRRSSARRSSPFNHQKQPKRRRAN